MAPIWWKESICYQVWPASFLDSDGDGLGDIPGLISKLDYLRSLEVNTIWLSPMYASPQVDMGYDISDYNAIYPPFGTLADVERLIAGVHERGMRIILDLVINHTSDQHAWFTESRTSRTNPKSDWYIWKDSKIVDGEKRPPNNWGGYFGGSAWEYGAERDQWYLHIFAKEQPDLNWENPETRRGIYGSAIRFWLQRGVDGFRVDTANNYSKDQRFLDMPVHKSGEELPFPAKYVFNGPRIHEFWQEMHREIFDDWKEVMLVGEVPKTSTDEIMKYIEGASELSMLFDFKLFNVGRESMGPWHEAKPWLLPEFKDAMMKTQRLVNQTGDAWVSMWLENHDSSRSLTRYGNDSTEYRDRATKLLAMLSCTSSGTVFMYQGQEIGMSNIPSSWCSEDLRDIGSKNYLRDIEKKYPGNEDMRQRAWQAVRALGRDNARTPVQWDDTSNAGFTSGEPWMRVNDNYETINVANQANDETSPLIFWRVMIRLRKEHAETLIHGIFETHDHDNPKTFTYTKTAASGAKALVVLNMSNEATDFSLLSLYPNITAFKLLVSNGRRSGKLEAWEALLRDSGRTKYTAIPSFWGEMSGSVPTVTQDDLDRFHAQHFQTGYRTLGARPSDGNALHQRENDDLGYYPDGVKRTLTADHIAMFRHSEIQTLLRERRHRAEQSESDGIEGGSEAKSLRRSASPVKQQPLEEEKATRNKVRKVSAMQHEKPRDPADGIDHVNHGHVDRTDSQRRTHRRIARELDAMNDESVELDY